MPVIEMPRTHWVERSEGLRFDFCSMVVRIWSKHENMDPCCLVSMVQAAADHVRPFMTSVPSSDGHFQQGNATCHKDHHLKLVPRT